MLQLTLDTGCVISSVGAEEGARWIDDLVALAQAGEVELWLTTAYDADQLLASPEQRRANLTWLSERPILGRAPAPFRIGYSRLDGGDTLIDDNADDDLLDVSAAIQKLLGLDKFESSPLWLAEDPDTMARWRRKMNDVQHLLAHRMAGHDAFVTLDRKDILTRAADLQRATGIVVVDPADAVEMASRLGGSGRAVSRPT